MITLIRHSWGLNTDIFETNILNLAVVVGIVITFVGDALRSLLEHRRRIVLLALQEADQKARKVRQQLEQAKEALEIARLRAGEIRIQAIQTVEQEDRKRKKQLEKDLSRLREKRRQEIQLERQRIVQSVSQQVAEIALNIVENDLMITFGTQGAALSKRKELNKTRVQKTLRQLER